VGEGSFFFFGVPLCVGDSVGGGGGGTVPEKLLCGFSVFVLP